MLQLHDRARTRRSPCSIVEPTTPRANQSLFLSRALAIGDRPSFRVDEKARRRAHAARFRWARARRARRGRLRRAARSARDFARVIDGGGGIVFVPGSSRAETWASEWRALLPATIGPVVDRTSDAGGTLSSIDYAHPVFELFNAPRSGDFSTARFYRYRALTASAGRERLGAVRRRLAGARRAQRSEAGSVLIWASTIDSYWTNLPLQPVFLPFVHQLGKHAGRYADPRPWFIAGDVLDLSRHGELTAPFLGGRAADSSSELRLEAPSGARERLTATGPNHLVTLREQGFYELRGRDTPVGSGRPIAVNVDPIRVGSVASRSAGYRRGGDVGERAASAGSDFNAATPQDQERRQKVWWYLLLGALLVMAARDGDVESAVARDELRREGTGGGGTMESVHGTAVASSRSSSVSCAAFGTDIAPSARCAGRRSPSRASWARRGRSRRTR